MVAIAGKWEYEHMTQLETPPTTEPLTRHDYRRRARMLWNVAQIAVARAKEAETTLAEERTLRMMVEAENAELRTQIVTLQSDILANDAYFVDRNADGTWTVVRTMTANILLEDVKRENATLAERVRQLEAQLVYAKHCGT